MKTLYDIRIDKQLIQDDDGNIDDAKTIFMLLKLKDELPIISVPGTGFSKAIFNRITNKRISWINRPVTYEEWIQGLKE